MMKNNFNENNLPSQYRPLSPWAYFWYSVLFSLPVIGLICLLIFSFSSSNINRRNFARSFFCYLALLLIGFVIITVTGFGLDLLNQFAA